MALTFNPTQEDIDNFRTLVPDLDEQDIIRRLKGNNNNVAQAVGEYFDNPHSDSNKYSGWNEEVFSSDREGGSNNAGISFNIQGADDPGPFGPFSGAPSRPPSRTSNNKSPLGKIIDMSAEAAAADPNTSLTSQELHDREMEQAIAMSRAESGLPAQESGITGTDQVYFGPAARNESKYDQGQWGMVAVGRSSVQEVLLDPEPAERKRDLDVPAFLKPSIQNHRLGAILTIYHEIPLVRNLFLRPMDVLASYGYDKDWWAGSQIELPSITGDESPQEQTVDREFQRLMAFLDKTDRAYGSADALANMSDVKKMLRLAESRFVEAAALGAWKEVLESQNQTAPVKKIFSKGVVSEDQEETSQDFAILELHLPAEDSEFETIYDVADDALWPDLGPRDLKTSSYLSHVADVVAFKLEGHPDSYKKIVVPPVWYPDRYLEENRQAALDMRLKKIGVKETLEQAARMEDFLTSYQMRGPGGGKVVKLQDIFKASFKHDEAEIKGDELLEDPEFDGIPLQRQSKAAATLSSELHKIVTKIDEKLIALNESKEKAREELRELSKLYTEPSDDPFAPKLHPYTLRGVSTNKSTFYICRRPEVDLIDMDLDGDGKEPKSDQWWRIHYAPIGHSPITVEKTTEEQVMEATQNELRSSIVVYASEHAMEVSPVAIPKPLETFVRFDNAVFKAELAAPEDSDDPVWEPDEIPDSQAEESQPVGLSSPGKRKYHDSDDDDQNQNQNQRVIVTEKELRGSNDSGFGGGIMDDVIHSGGAEQHEIVVGVDPSLIMMDDNAAQEMKERGGLPMLTGRKMSVAQMDTIDNMDLDQVVADENVAHESTAVKRVGFAE